ncbi:hypothetical protein CDL15_Pgr013394 [Punica granatum]|uniref:Uncharacterized protein n=1 Tax=Punica granatum TaxID=22663 RepID=A0A218W012_PUNGR|nr:hypothetical protein CDL15_Pgr013394 [Punica granatum]
MDPSKLGKGPQAIYPYRTQSYDNEIPRRPRYQSKAEGLEVYSCPRNLSWTEDSFGINVLLEPTNHGVGPPNQTNNPVRGRQTALTNPANQGKAPGRLPIQPIAYEELTNLACQVRYLQQENKRGRGRDVSSTTPVSSTISLDPTKLNRDESNPT